MCIYIYRHRQLEREREREIYIYIYICICQNNLIFPSRVRNSCDDARIFPESLCSRIIKSLMSVDIFSALSLPSRTRTSSMVGESRNLLFIDCSFKGRYRNYEFSYDLRMLLAGFREFRAPSFCKKSPPWHHG